MIRLLAILVFMLPVLVYGQPGEPKVLSISRFAGLNTATGDMERQPNESIVDINLDHSRYGVGSFGKRYGYDSVSFLAGQDEIIGLDAVYLSDYRQYLGIVTDSTNVGYGNIYASPYGQASFVGHVILTIFFNTINSHLYVDSLVLDDDTTVVSYMSDGSATCSEIAHGLADTINNHSTLGNLVTATVDSGSIWQQCDWWVRTITDVEGTAFTMMSDDLLISEKEGVTNTRIWSPYSVQNKPDFAQFNDEWFIVNGAQKGVRYDGNVARSWPPNAPGEPSIIPLSDTGAMDGEYVYTFRVSSSKSADSLMSQGYASAPIRVRAGQVMLKDFGFPAADTTDPTPDSIMIFGYRTRANPGPLDEGDYAFFFDTILLATSATNLGDSIYIDSIGDDGLSTTDSVALVHDVGASDWIGRDSTGVIDVRYGAPGFLDIPTWVNQGIFKGIPEQNDTLGVVYQLTYIDTINGDESDAGPLAAVWVDEANQGGGTTKPGSIRLALPGLPDTGLVYNLYRAHILQVTYDSSYAILLPDPRLATIRSRHWVEYNAVDTTIIADFRLVAQISSDSSTFTDSVSYDSLQVSEVFRGAVPPLLSGVFSHDNFLFGWDGSFLVWSDLDSAGNWGAFQRQSVNRDDGDAITVAFATRTGIRILKNYTNYNLYDTRSKLEKVGDWGCIAPRSYAAADNGHFYLSARGVVFETEGLQLERTVVSGLVSTKLRNFDLLTIETKHEAVGRWYPTEGKYWLTIGDTNYVYDKRAADLLGEEVWGIWAGMVFTDGTLYNTEDVLSFLPGSDFYFIQDGSPNLFLYGSSETDPRSTEIRIQWENANMLVDPGWKSELTNVGIRAYSDSTSDILWVSAIDETGTVTVGNIRVDSLNQYYRVMVFGRNRALEHGIQIASLPPTYQFLGGRVERIDIWYEPRIEPIIKR